MAEHGVLSFTMAGPSDGERQRFDFSYDPDLLSGDQTELIRERTGMSALAWLKRVAQFDLETFDERDLLVMAYLAVYRQNELVEWRPFLRTVSPFSVDIVNDDEDQAADDDPPAEEQKPAPSKPAGRSRSRKVPATNP